MRSSLAKGRRAKEGRETEELLEQVILHSIDIGNVGVDLVGYNDRGCLALLEE
jgi:hypothetical protein